MIRPIVKPIRDLVRREVARALAAQRPKTKLLEAELRRLRMFPEDDEVEQESERGHGGHE